LEVPERVRLAHQPLLLFLTGSPAASCFFAGVAVHIWMRAGNERWRPLIQTVSCPFGGGGGPSVAIWATRAVKISYTIVYDQRDDRFRRACRWRVKAILRTN